MYLLLAMVNKIFILILGVFGLFNASAQKTKTDVLVTGRENWAAALQSAISAVNTTFVYSPGSFPLGQINQNLPSGISAELLKRTQGNTSAAIINTTIQKWMDTTKNLTLIQVQEPVSPVSSGSGWMLKLSDGSSIKAKVAISTKSTTVMAMPIDYAKTAYRTSLLSGIYDTSKKTTATFLRLADFLDPEIDNAVFVPAAEIQAAQAAGAIAAYAAFFKTKTSLSNFKRIQGELLGHKLALVPLADVTAADSSWRAIQNLTLMGVLKPVLQNGQLLFKPQQPVQIEEVKQPLKDLYYKAQIWFDDNPSGIMSLEKTIALVCYVGNKSEVAVRAAVEKKWSTDFRKEGVLDYKKAVSRTTFSILLNDYLRPADVSIDRTGRITR